MQSFDWKWLIQFIIIILFTTKFSLSYQPYQEFQVNQIRFYQPLPCQLKQDSQSSTLKFSQLFPGQNETQRIVFAIFTTFYGYNAYDYTLFSIHQSNLVISLDYNLQQNKIFLKINGVSQETQNSMISINLWVGVGLDIFISQDKIQAQLFIQLLGTNNVYTQSSFQQPFTGGSLLTNELEINYGNPPKRLGVLPSCQFVSFFSIGTSNLVSATKIQDIFNDILQIKIEIVYNYDFFYTLSNQGQILSNKGDIFLKQNVNQQFNNTISINNNQISINQIDINNQMTLSFYIKFSELPTTLGAYLCIYFDQNKQCLYFGSNEIRLDNSILVQQNVLVWNQIVLIKQLNMHLFFNGVKINEVASFNPAFRAKYSFFSAGSPYQLNHIIFYRGSYGISYGNCYLQTSDGFCIICMNGYLLDFQNNMQCAEKNTSNSDSEILGVKDWDPPRIICQKNMINDNSSPSGCKCLLGYYLDEDDNRCIKCPNYCRYCSSLQDCLKQRDSKGNCSNQNAFDNGQDCLMPLFVIPQRQNTRRKLEKPDFGPACVNSNVDPDLNNFIFTKDQLNIQTGDSIFISFSLIAKTVNQQFSELIIATIKDNNNIIMKITLSCQIINSVYILFVKYFVKDQLQSEFIFDSNELAWIAFWTDNSNYLFLFRTNRYNYYDNQTGSFQFLTPSSIELCVGRCDTNLIGCLSLTSYPITFIKNIPLPSQLDAIDQFFTIYQDDFPLIGRYKIDVNQIQPITYITDTSDQPGQPKLQFDNPLQIFNQFQGFQLTEMIHAFIIFPLIYEDLFTISFSIEFDPSFQYQQFKLLEIINEGSNLQMYLSPDYDQEILVVQICYQNICKTFNKAVLLLKQSNFFLLTATVEAKKLRLVSPISILYLDIVCNYTKDTLEVSTIPGTKVKQINFGETITQYKVFLDNINIYQQNVFIYYDFTKSNPCFVYFNLESMKCGYLKTGYLYYNNQIITQKECYQMSLRMKQLAYINSKDQTCNLKQPINLEEYFCAIMQYQTGQLKCIECKDQNADPNSSCLVCKQSYFLNNLTNKCEKCDPKCKSCREKSSNCADCEYINQIMPSCDCVQQNQALKNVCTCNQKCKTCSGIDSNFCLSCNGENRLIPSCECMPNYIENQNRCVKIEITCIQKCQSCQITSDNCTICSQNRVNPPLCHCSYGYEEHSDGNCVACWKGTQYDPLTQTCKGCSPDQINGSLQNLGKQCLNSLSVQISSSYLNKKYYINFTFEKNLHDFTLTKIDLNTFITFYIPEIPSNLYELTNPKYINNQFQVQLDVKASFSADQIFATIHSNKYFLSEDEQYILHPKYLKIQMKAKIGPFVLEENQTENTGMENLSNQLNELKSANTNVFSIINQLQIVFYILNTLQPISALLLLNAIYPPQLYLFYKIVGTFVLPQVPDYLKENSNKQMSLFGYEFQEKDAKQPDFGKFKSLGFSQSILINIPILVIKQFFLLFLIVSVKICQYFTFKKRHLLLNIKIILIQILNGDQETSLSIVFFCSFVQFIEINEESHIYRIGFYICIILIFVQVLMLKFNIQNISSKCEQKREYSSIYTDRIQQGQNWLGIYYFQFQTVKKYVYLAVVCIFFKYPILVCSTCGVIFLISAVYTILVKAYKSKKSRIIKCLGEMIFSFVWFLHLPIIYFEQKFQQDKVIDDKQLQQYTLIGNVILWLLVAFNCLFLIQFAINLFQQISKLIQKLKNSNSSTSHKIVKKF